MDSKTLTLELDDYRVLDFRLTGKTKYYKAGEELKSPKFAEGDQLSVEGPYDEAGALTAVNVYWEKQASATVTSNDKKEDAPVDTWKDKDKDKDAAKAAPASAASGEVKESATEDAPPPARKDPDDPGRPTLKRGKPVERAAPPEPPAEPTPTVAPRAVPSKAEQTKAEPAKQVAINLPPNNVPLPPNTVALPPPSTTTAPRAATPAPPRAPDPSPNFVNLPPSTVSLPRPQQPQEDAVVTAPSDREPELERLPLGVHPDDPLIRMATEAALAFTETLPNYVCQEVVSRYQSESRPVSFHALDIVSTDLVYENGKEDYRNVTINGKPANKKLEETGAWSTGEFGTLLIDLFSPATAAEFTPHGQGRIAGVEAKMYSFDVKRENSHWSLHFGSQSYEPAYSGTTWIDPKTGRVLRIEMQARNLPQAFPVDQVESAVDYQYIRLGGTQEYLLPTHSENLSCQRGTAYCSKNVIDFRNYHKYTGESSIQFGDVKDDSAAPAAPNNHK